MDSSLALMANFGFGAALVGALVYFSFIDDDDGGDDEIVEGTDTDTPEDPTPDEDVVLIEDLITSAPTMDEDASPDVLSSLATSETITGGEGDDTLDGSGETLSRSYDGGAGDDFILAAKVADAAEGGDGDDTIRPAAGDDLSYGGAGDDVIADGFGRDIIYGGEGADSLSGGANGDFLQGGAGADTLIGDGGSDYLAGGSGNDVIDGRADQGDGPKDDGVDSLFGSTGSDQLFLDNGDQAEGGEGADLFTIDEAAAGDGAVMITDFDAATDEIAIEYTGGADAEIPTLGVNELDDGSGSQISFNDQPIATVAGVENFDASSVTLIDKAEEDSVS